MKRLSVVVWVALIAALGFSQAAAAEEIMPSFASVPTGWTVDRYAPASFSNVGTFQGRNDVLGISIASSGTLANRPGSYQSTFYNTQGMGYALTGSTGDSISADLFLAESWSDAANGYVRTDIWGVMTDSTAAVTDYPILGFTNYGGQGRFRAWDGTTGWNDLQTPVTYGQWARLGITFTGTGYEYSINGAPVLTLASSNGTTGFSRVIMQAYNFGDPSLAGANVVDYTAHWADAQPVPEPATLSLIGLGLAGIARAARRRKA